MQTQIQHQEQQHRRKRKRIPHYDKLYSTYELKRKDAPAYPSKQDEDRK
jgi:hypothetical protein